MADTVLTEFKIHVFDTDEQMKVHDGGIGENDLVFTDDTSIRLPILTPMWFDHQTNDESWLNADTFSWQPSDKYKHVYEHLVADLEAPQKHDVNLYRWGAYYYTTTETPVIGDLVYDDTYTAVGKIIAVVDTVIHFNLDTGVSGLAGTRDASGDTVGAVSEYAETIGAITITYYLAQDGHKICLPDQESNLSALYESTGVAWYYILDTENKQFKLPRTKYGFTGLRDSVGGYVVPGLPNIAGTFTNNGHAGYAAATGAFTSTKNGTHSNEGGASDGGFYSFDASRSSSIYGNGDTVQPPATQMHLYFWVGAFDQTATEQTAGLNAELFNGKVDVDLNNINPSNSAKAMIVGWGMPDYSAAVSMSSGSSAPKNGWAIAHGLNATVTYSVNGVSVAQGSWNSGKWSGNWNLQIMVSAGDVVTGGSWKFIPCKGVN